MGISQGLKNISFFYGDVSVGISCTELSLRHGATDDRNGTTHRCGDGVTKVWVVVVAEVMITSGN